jgi:hypothetical protein
LCAPLTPTLRPAIYVFFFFFKKYHAVNANILVNLRYGIHSSGYLYRLFSSPALIHTYPPVNIEPTECSETSAFNIQTTGKYPEESIPYLKHGESLKTAINLGYFTQYRAGDKIEKNEMGGACSAYGGRGELCIVFWWGNLREGNSWGDRGVDGRIMLGWIFKKWDVGVRTGLGWLRIGTGAGRL